MTNAAERIIFAFGPVLNCAYKYWYLIWHVNHLACKSAYIDNKGNLDKSKIK